MNDKTMELIYKLSHEIIDAIAKHTKGLNDIQSVEISTLSFIFALTRIMKLLNEDRVDDYLDQLVNLAKDFYTYEKTNKEPTND